MDEREQLGGLYAVAQKQQEAASTAIEVLGKQKETVVHAVQALANASVTLNNLPASIEATIRKTTHTAIVDGLVKTSKEAIAQAVDAATAAAVEFETVAKTASKDAQEAARNARSAISGIRAWVFLTAFLLGTLVGAGGLWMIHEPQAGPVNLDAAAVAKHLQPALAEACRKR